MAQNAVRTDMPHSRDASLTVRIAPTSRRMGAAEALQVPAPARITSRFTTATTTAVVGDRRPMLVRREPAGQTSYSDGSSLLMPPIHAVPFNNASVKHSTAMDSLYARAPRYSTDSRNLCPTELAHWAHYPEWQSNSNGHAASRKWIHAGSGSRGAEIHHRAGAPAGNGVRRISDSTRRQLRLPLQPHPIPYWGEFAHLPDQWLLVDEHQLQHRPLLCQGLQHGVRISNPCIAPIPMV